MNETINTQTTDGTQQAFDPSQMPPQPPTSDGTQMQAFDPSQMPPQPPTSDGTQQAFDPSQMTTSDGTQMQAFDPSQMPTSDGTQMQAFDPSQMTTSDGTQMQAFDPSQMPTSDGTQMQAFDPTQMPQMPPPPPMFGQGGFGQGGFGQGGFSQGGFGQGFMAPPPDMNAWGNGEFAGEQLLNGENITATDDLSAITDAGTDISVNFGEQNGFGFPPPGMMPFTTDGGQITDQSTATDTQAE